MSDRLERKHVDTLLAAFAQPQNEIASAMYAMLAVISGLINQRDAWQAYARHLEQCRTCASDQIGLCDRGAVLQEAADA